LTVLKESESIPRFWKGEAYSFQPENGTRGKAHGLYGYSLPGLRKAPRKSAAEKTINQVSLQTKKSDHFR
jgi:hypothetical protein